MATNLKLGPKATVFRCPTTKFHLDRQDEVKAAKQVSPTMRSWIQAGGLVEVTPEEAEKAQSPQDAKHTLLEQFEAFVEHENPSVAKLEDFCRQTGLDVPKYSKKDELIQGIKDLLAEQAKAEQGDK